MCQQSLVLEMPTEPAESLSISAVAALEEPTRRGLYDYVVRQTDPVSRDQAAEALGLPRANVAFHLDKLTDAGLLDVSFQRLTGRSGPGAGRTAKLYRRSARHINLTVPERKYELVGMLLASAIEDAEAHHSSPQHELHRRAQELGLRLGAAAERGEDRPTVDDEVLLAVLERCGFEPHRSNDEITLRNCPFHALVQDHTDLICGMNLSFVEGILEGAEAAQCDAHLLPSADACCVRLRRAQPGQNDAPDREAKP